MRREEAEAAADALLQPERERQRKMEAHAQMRFAWLQSRGQRVWRMLAILGFLSGGAIGHFVFGKLTMGLIMGAAAGSALGAIARALVNRRSAP